MAKTNFSKAIEKTLMGRPPATSNVKIDEQQIKEKTSSKEAPNTSKSITPKKEQNSNEELRAASNSEESQKKESLKDNAVQQNTQSEIKEHETKKEISNITPQTEVVPAEKVLSEVVVLGATPKKNLGGRPKTKTVPHEKITVDLPSDLVEMVKEYALKEYGNNMTTYIRRLIARDIKKNIESYKEKAELEKEDEWNWK